MYIHRPQWAGIQFLMQAVSPPISQFILSIILRDQGCDALGCGNVSI